MSETKRLIVVMAFDRDEEENLLPVDEGMQCQSEHQAKPRASELSRKHAGVIAWARKALRRLGNMGSRLKSHGMAMCRRWSEALLALVCIQRFPEVVGHATRKR